MQNKILTPSDILTGYDAVSALYPHIPSLSHWRAWEYAAYRRHSVDGRILDLGCGDGRYFRLLWPDAEEVVGVELNPDVAELARQSDVYRDVHLAPAHRVPEPDGSFDHVFANCSLEHMDYLDAVLGEVHRCLKRRGTLLCSVVTNRFVEWSPLPKLVAQAGFGDVATALQKDFLDYHHLANPLSVDEWVKSFRRAGLVPEEHIPILPKNNSGLFLLMDSLWHVRRSVGGELGDVMFSFLSANPKFPGAFRSVLAGLLEMETDWQECSGAVFLLRKGTS
jgi:SAM-dependent methyltransferase